QQIVAMTYPMIGNYGVNKEDMESSKVQVAGFVVREYQSNYSNFRATSSLADFLIEQKIPAIQEVDTRRLTRHIREKGALRGIIAVGNWDDKILIKKVLESPKMTGLNLAEKVSSTVSYNFPQQDRQNQNYYIIALDLGIKTNILRMLSARGCFITVKPFNTTAEEILKLNPDGIFLSNGPGDPAVVKSTIDTVKELINKKPIFGICLGHQILAHAIGGKTFKLKFGHRGGNHPVKNLKTNAIEITSQNHGFAVDDSSLPPEAEITHINLNDNTVEGIRHKNLPIFSVQYHPESSPGPHDSSYLFDEFIELIKSSK
ncbi:MAG: glutamine-hydrolyzing carbamoyl-phosphate synthase small subunit, partial [Spirochaetota bacterium]|nr:glutamine-hydrolyzing carbamoyl-phosphate synthase small subunit [Spirochaetota bacterium]